MNNKDNKEIKNDEIKNNLDELMNEATSNEGVAEFKEKIEKEKKKGKYKPYIITLVSVLVLGSGAFYFVPKINNSNTNDSNSSISKKGNSSSGSNDGSNDKDGSSTFNKEKEIAKSKSLGKDLRPTTLEDWQSQVFTDDKAVYQETIDFVEATSFINLASMLPSEKNGFTSDTNKLRLEDGTLNPMYSYQTQENVEYAFGNYINRLTNPVFGSWASLPNGIPGGVESEFNPMDFDDMFTSRWWMENTQNGSYRAVPIYADWDGNNWGGVEVDERSNGVFFGEIKSIYATGEPTDDNTGLDIEATVVLDYVAIDKNKKKVVRPAEMRLKLVPNIESDDPYHRALIDDISLTMK